MNGTLVIALVITVTLFVFLTLRILGVALREPETRSEKLVSAPPRPARAQPPRAPGSLAGKPSVSGSVQDLRKASSRLVIALLLIAAGAALLIFLAVRWIGSLLENILS